MIKIDYLRCNPKFYGYPRYDSVIVNSDPDPYFARLICLFTCMFNGQSYPLALIQPFTSVYTHRNRKQKDIDFELLRLRKNFRKDFQIVSIYTFIRGAVIIESGETPDPPGPAFKSRDYFLFDLLDPDMFLRGRNEIERYVLPLPLFVNQLTEDMW